MKFQFSEKKVRLPENVHAYAEKKVTKLDRYFNGDAEALVAFSVMKNRNQVELTVHAANTWFRARESTSDMFASIDAAVATIEGQIRKNKTRLARRLRQDAFVHLQRLPLSYLDRRPVGDIVSRVIADADQVTDGLLIGFTQLFTGILTILGTLVFMLTINPLVTAWVVLITPLSLFVASFVARRTSVRMASLL